MDATSQPRSTRSRRRAALAVVAMCCVTGCAEPPAPEPAPAPPEGEAASVAQGNLLRNPGFESGRSDWVSLEETGDVWRDFAISETQAHRGTRSAQLNLESDEDSAGARIYGVVQEFEASALPRYLSGWYRVEGWRRGSAKQYVQAVVIGIDPRMPGTGEAVPGNFPGLQVAYVLAGIRDRPVAIGNRWFAFSGPTTPIENEWIPFEFQVPADFERLFGINPGISRVRVLFEVRWDDRAEDDPPAAATVYFDDLYLGPESRMRF